jgi:hypothetical protein
MTAMNRLVRLCTWGALGLAMAGLALFSLVH